MHRLWLAEIGKHPRKAVTLLYDRDGKPFFDTDILQERVRRLMEQIGAASYVSNGRTRLCSFHGLRKNAACYLAELGLSDPEIGAICGMTSDTVRHYTKRARALMIAQGAAAKVKRGDVLSIKGGTRSRRR
jgi:integrase